jgi:cobalt-zinc-cadmium efflux system outer membrane protein
MKWSWIASGALMAFVGCATRPDAVDPRIDSAIPPVEGNRVSRSVEPGGMAEPSGELTLKAALALALARHPGLAAFSWELRAAEARLLQSRLRPNPEAGVEVEDMLGTGAFRDVSEAQTTLRLSQVIELGGKRAARVRAETSSRQLAGWDYEARRAEILATTADAFIEVLSLQERLALADESVRLAEKAAESVQRRVDAARVFAVEGTRARVALATVQIERQRLDRELESARHRLAASWGSEQPAFDRVQGTLEPIPPIPDLAALRGELERNPDLARWAAEIAQRDAKLELEKSRRIPDVEFGGGYRYLNGPGESAMVGGVSVPLPLFNRNQGNIDEAKHQLSRAREEQRAAALRLNLELGQAWRRLASAAAEVTAIRDEVLSGARETFEAVSGYYDEGRVSYLEVLDAQRTWFTVRAQYLQALTEYHQALNAIEKLTGRLAPERTQR